MNLWYEKGLYFHCTGCGQCCTGSPGYVWVSPEEIESMAVALDMPLDEFAKKYVRRVGNRYSLKEDPRTFDCVFLKGKRCTIYTHRPQQCRSFPWWDENLATDAHWKDAAQYCEGINHPDAKLITLGEIRQQREENGLTEDPSRD